MDLPKNRQEYRNLDCSELDFTDRSLEQARFIRCRFKGASMQGIHTAHCFFEECDFTFARLNDSFHQMCIRDSAQIMRRGTGRMGNGVGNVGGIVIFTHLEALDIINVLLLSLIHI